jgi:aminoglycoside phosphotransferase
LGYESTDERQCLLISEIKGIAASEYVAENRHNSGAIYSFVEKTAAAMREIHTLPIGNCSFAQNIDVKLAAARENIRRGFVDESDFEHENLGRKADDLYDELVKTKLSSEDLVFTHGDLCLPNFMVINGEISGFIDFDRGGVADRYQDIALFLRSFAFNIEIPVNITEVFCNAYGIDSLDHEKIRYYRLLDELF